jgi:hypothetical protein
MRSESNGNNLDDGIQQALQNKELRVMQGGRRQ